MEKQWSLGKFLITIHRQYPEFGVHFVRRGFCGWGFALVVDIGSWGIILDYGE